MMPIKQKKCAAKDCGAPFTPYLTTQKVCSPNCAIEYTRQRQNKRYKAETRRLRREHRANDRGLQVKLAQRAFNAYIRERDKDLPCISSGRTTGQMHAGHYKSIGAHPELRFNEFNVNKQSMKDNAWLSGNIEGYRKGLIEKYGVKVVEWLEGPHEPKKYTLDELKEIQQIYREKKKALTQ